MCDNGSIRILLADDHQIFREGLKALLEEEGYLNVTLQASNGKEVIDLLEEHTVDLVMMDIHMPIMDGFESTREIKKKYPDLPILALTMAAEKVDIKKMLNKGANGYLLKNSGKKELIKAIDTVLTGEQYYNDAVGQIVMESLSGKKIDSHNPIEINPTPREIEIIKLIATEHSNKEIASKLFISQRTVDAHKRNILKKLKAKNAAGITRYAMEHLNLE